jgi:hypothetical protein
LQKHKKKARNTTRQDHAVPFLLRSENGEEKKGRTCAGIYFRRDVMAGGSWRRTVAGFFEAAPAPWLLTLLLLSWLEKESFNDRVEAVSRVLCVLGERVRAGFLSSPLPRRRPFGAVCRDGDCAGERVRRRLPVRGTDPSRLPPSPLTPFFFFNGDVVREPVRDDEEGGAATAPASTPRGFTAERDGAMPR